MDEKIQLVRDHHTEYGLNRCCEALALSKGTWHYRVNTYGSRDEEDNLLETELYQGVLDHPGYGYRRLKPELDERMGKPINHKRILELLKKTNLGFARQVTKHKVSPVVELIRDHSDDVDLVRGQCFGLLEALSTDFTELLYAGGSKKAWFMATVDIAGKWVPGWALGPARNRELARKCWEKTLQSFRGIGMDVEGMIVHSDQDSVYTSYDWLRLLLLDSKVRVSFSQNGARHNPWVESMWGRIKIEIHSLITEAKDLPELEGILDQHMNYYNKRRRHSTIGNQTPWQYLQQKLHREDIAAN